ncbi:hypothetical protein VTH06DRAFT_7079 [Thermothelomyces fergusii]
MAPPLARARRTLGAVIGIATRRVGRLAAHVVSSRLLQQTVIATTLLAIAGVLLYIPAVLGYLFLYYRYLPELVTTVPVHLQYGVGPNPFGIASLEGIASRQPYDITVSLSLPRSPANLDRGNFMIALHLLSPVPAAGSARPQTGRGLTLPYLPPANPGPDASSSSSSASTSSRHSLDALLQPTRLDLPSFLASHTIVHTTTRPALIPYVDPLASQATRVLLLFYHMLAPRAAATVRLDVPMAEGLSFSSSSSSSSPSSFSYPQRRPPLPESLLLEVQAGQGIQVYDARVTLVARLRGLRAFMYRWKVTAFVAVTGAFWAGGMAVLACEEEEEERRKRKRKRKRGRGGEHGSGPGSDDDDGGGGGGGGKGGGRRVKGGEKARDGERRFKTESTPPPPPPSFSSPSSSSLSFSFPAPGRGEAAEKSVKKEEGSEGDVMARVPRFEAGHGTEADDEAESEPGGSKRWKGKAKEVKAEEAAPAPPWMPWASGPATAAGRAGRRASSGGGTPLPDRILPPPCRGKKSLVGEGTA